MKYCMQPQFRIVCRGSKLSLSQAGLFRNKLVMHLPEAKVEVVIKETKGDSNLDLPLHEMEGKDFFTQDIQDYLISGQADFAIHSLKDVSGENFFQGNHYAIIEREEPRDVAIFNEEVLDKLKAGDKITLGTSSPRRVEMATGFLRAALPWLGNHAPQVATASIRGNVDTRLQKLVARDYDGLILACAGLIRLLRSDSRQEIFKLLKGKMLAVLPLMHCPPAPGQGAIVVETTPDNERAVKVLEALNNRTLAAAVDEERKVAHRYGSGCHQKFGVIHIDKVDSPFIFAAGMDRNDGIFNECFSMQGANVKIQREPASVNPSDPFYREHQVALITPQDVGTMAGLGSMIPGKKIWVSETSTWFDLAKRGVWVEGSLEGFGRNFIEGTIRNPLVSRAAE
jgi:hydroxymethylbilane synthase